MLCERFDNYFLDFMLEKSIICFYKLSLFVHIAYIAKSLEMFFST